MFQNLRNFSPVPEPSATTVVVTDTPAQPPMRFGAVRIDMKSDPDRPEVTIEEVQSNDYVVYISREILGGSYYYAELITLLRTLPAGAKVTIYISSPGGVVHSGAMIAAAIQASKATVTTVAIGVVASAASLIWSYGHHRRAADGAVLMFHMSSHFDIGNSVAIKRHAEMIIRYIKLVAVDPLVEQGLLTPDEAESIVERRRNVWLDSETVNARLEAADVKAH